MSDGPEVITLLDTHVWIWMVEGDRGALSSSAIEAIEEASRNGLVAISAISVWEVAMLAGKGRISFSRRIDEWVRLALEAPGVRLLGLGPEIALESARLPGEVHGDPADRILIASARITGGRLVTCDSRIIEYSRQGHLSVFDARP